MKTFIICTSPEGKAIPNYFFTLSKELSKRGNKIIIVVDQASQEKPLHEELKIYTWPSKRPNKIVDFLFFYRLCKKYKPDVTLGQFGSTNVVLIIGKILNVPNRLIYWHTMFEQLSIDSTKTSVIQSILNLRKKILIKYLATNVLINSKENKADLISHYNLKKQKVHILNYLIPDFFKSEKILSKLEREFAISFVGRIDKSKGQEKIINSIPNLLSIYPDIKIYFIGDGSERNRLAEKCRKLEIHHNVIFTGVVNLQTVYEYMGKTLIHLSASTQEAFGLVNAEALSAGTPILANKVGGINEILINGENGFFFNPNNKSDFVINVQKLIDGDWEQFSKNARTSFINRFSSNTSNLEKQIKLLDKITSHKK